MYFRRFKEDSEGRQRYGKGFVFHYGNKTFILGVKLRRCRISYLYLRTKHVRSYIFRLGFCVITLEYRNIDKDPKSFIKNVWRIKKKDVSLPHNDNEIKWSIIQLIGLTKTGILKKDSI